MGAPGAGQTDWRRENISALREQSRRAMVASSIRGCGAGESAGEIGVEQAVEEVLAGFATDGKTAGNIGARAEAALHGIADGHVLVLHLFADGDALAIVLVSGAGSICEIIIEDHRTFIDR